MGKKKVSVILCTYNSKEHIGQTLDAILQQDYPAVEAVVADGGSDDGTLEILSHYRDLFAQKGKELKWKSEPDRGIFDAMNKGYRDSTGEIIVFLNDLLTGEDVISRMVRAIEKGEEGCIGAHSDLVYASEKKIIRYWQMGEGKIRQGWMPGHPTLYLKREVYEKYGLYKTDYRCSADYEFMVRVLKDETNRLAYVPGITVRMYYGGTSTGGVRAYWISLAEGHRALKENGIRFAWLVDAKRTCRLLMQFFRAGKAQKSMIS